MILLVTSDTDFAAAASKIISEELSVACDCAQNLSQVKNISAYQLLVMDSAEPDTELPIVLLGARPCSMPELLIKIDRQLCTASLDTPIELGTQYTLSRRDRQLVCRLSGQHCALTDKEMELLYQLHRAGDTGVDKEALLQDVWGIEDNVSTRTLETHIYRLRNKLKNMAGNADAISLSEGKYRLVL